MPNPLLSPCCALGAEHPRLSRYCRVFSFDVVIPDIVPFADELLLGLGTLLLANWKKRKVPTDPIEPPR